MAPRFTGPGEKIGSSVWKENVPYPPSRSGVPIPANVLPRLGTGGKFEGRRKTVRGIPRSSRYCQKALPCRKSNTSPSERGNTQLPNRRLCLGGFPAEVKKYAVTMAGARRRESEVP